MHAVFMGMPTASRNGGGGDASLHSDGVRNQKWWMRPDEPLTGTQLLTALA